MKYRNYPGTREVVVDTRTGVRNRLLKKRNLTEVFHEFSDEELQLIKKLFKEENVHEGKIPFLDIEEVTRRLKNEYNKGYSLTLEKERYLMLEMIRFLNSCIKYYASKELTEMSQAAEIPKTPR